MNNVTINADEIVVKELRELLLASRETDRLNNFSRRTKGEVFAIWLSECAPNSTAKIGDQRREFLIHDIIRTRYGVEASQAYIRSVLITRALLGK